MIHEYIYVVSKIGTQLLSEDNSKALYLLRTCRKDITPYCLFEMAKNPVVYLNPMAFPGLISYDNTYMLIQLFRMLYKSYGAASLFKQKLLL